MRTIGQRTLLPTTRKLLVDTLLSSRNLRLDSKLYHASPRRLHEARKSEPATFWQEIGNDVDRCINHRMYILSGFLLGSVPVWAYTLGAVPGTEESLCRQKIWSHLMSIRRYGILILAREAREANGEKKSEDSEETEDAENAEDARQGLSRLQRRTTNSDYDESCL